MAEANEMGSGEGKICLLKTQNSLLYLLSGGHQILVKGRELFLYLGENKEMFTGIPFD